MVARGGAKRNPWNSSTPRARSPGGATESETHMPQTYTQLHYHLIFSTKNRTPTITSQIQPRLWKYMGGIVKGLKGIPIQIGGMPDHVHLLVTLRQQPALADVLREIKASSSGWIHETFPHLSAFAWQTGYGAFSVSHSGVPKVKDYIKDQAKHHKKLTFQDEYRLLLTKHGIEFDERYLWD